MTASFLSNEWFTALAARLEASPPLSGEGSLRLGQLVPDGPSGESRWTLCLSGGKVPTIEIGTTETADVVLVEGYEAARALAAGERGAAELLEAGDVKLRGDVAALVASLGLLEEAVGLLAP